MKKKAKAVVRSLNRYPWYELVEEFEWDDGDDKKGMLQVNRSVDELGSFRGGVSKENDRIEGEWE
jgi:hypothetical protein